MGRQQLLDKKSSAWPGWHRYRFGVLLAALLGMLVYGPLIELMVPRLAPIATRLALVIMLGWLTISAVYAVSDQRRTAVVAVMLGIPLMFVELVDFSLLRSESHVLSQALGILFLCNIVTVLLGFIFRQTRVATDVIFASLCVYLLLGIIWAFIYSLLEGVQPDAFSYLRADDQRMRFGSEGTTLSLYFSFVTMTTLGYGDIAPVSSAARSLATLQAICGQFYLTVVVAWLVGLKIAHSRSATN